jgi:hypothetical protein
MNKPSLLLSLLFSALAGAGAFLWVRGVEGALGTDAAVAVFTVGLVPLLLLWAAPSFAVWWPAPLVCAAVSISALAFARIAVLERPFRLRSLGAEALMGGAALAAAACAFDRTALGSAMAVWLACVVEIAGTARTTTVQPKASTPPGPFESARDQVLQILEAEERRSSEQQ